MNIYKRGFISFILIFLLTNVGCLDLRSCKASNLIGRYYCENDENADNYLFLAKDGTYVHTYISEGKELNCEGTWKSNIDKCTIELTNWKDFNVNGSDYNNFMYKLLFINGDYLDIGPDGDSQTSFIKEGASR